MSDKIIEAFLIYLSIGSLIWLILDGLGIIDNTYAKRNSHPRAMVLATLYMILAWPWFIAMWLKGMWSIR